MSYKTKILIGLMLFVAFNSYAFQHGEPTATPNIILIMADDLGYETLGVNGGQSYQTPNLDKMAQDGMNFTQCYATPLCTTSRVQLMTGKYNFRNYIGFGLLDPKEKTFAHYLKESGYSTLIAGKWQLYGNAHQQELAGGKVGTTPEMAGFDDYCLWQIKQLGSRYKAPLITSPRKTFAYKGAFGPDIFTNYITDFIEENTDEPFFVYYPMVLTHDPFVPTPDDPDFGDFDAASKVNDPAYFGQMVNYMDKLIGRIWSKVDSLGIAEDTLIIFIGDNGTDNDIISLVDNKSFQGDKGQPTIAGTHVPMIAYWKGHIDEGKVNENLVDFTDFLPTLMEAAQVKQEDAPTDGISFYPQLINQVSKTRKWVFCHYDPHWGKFKKSRYVHDERLMLYDDGRIFNLINDPLEMSTTQEDALNQLDKKKLKEFKEVLDNYQ
ncbi:arylsulfatase [Echinicola strongylocentroti]|uniref:Arylsulfatase n=1 Tax=Echinicola strongylocentroti TaxID=1795355 RepID=A0A2Z4IJL1_9BACT|nr:sulfatase-like hydrolase/transferase [Echinicola strongylocentroti]AWW30880.1 arylsulfatase [Echinicola strongylocentroti]